eukprot:scaffold768_cov355-Pinguiococcus_pyrenoidosus.AAC.2
MVYTRITAALSLARLRVEGMSFTVCFWTSAATVFSHIKSGKPDPGDTIGGGMAPQKTSGSWRTVRQFAHIGRQESKKIRWTAVLLTGTVYP